MLFDRPYTQYLKFSTRVQDLSIKVSANIRELKIKVVAKQIRYPLQIAHTRKMNIFETFVHITTTVDAKFIRDRTYLFKKLFRFALRQSSKMIEIRYSIRYSDMTSFILYQIENNKHFFHNLNFLKDGLNTNILIMPGNLYHLKFLKHSSYSSP